MVSSFVVFVNNFLLNVNDLVQQVTCPICQDTFQNPKMVSLCRHTFCEGCIKEYVEKASTNDRFSFGFVSSSSSSSSSRKYPCPVCRKEFDKDLHVENDFRMQSLVDILQNNRVKRHICSIHKGETLKFICCDRMICSFCAATQHEGHRKVEIDRLAKEEKENLKQMVSNELPKLKTCSQNINALIESIEKEYNDESTKIAAAVSALKSEIDNIHTRVKNELEQMKKERLRRLEEQKTVLCTLISKLLEKNIQQIEQCDNIEILEFKKAMDENHNKVQKLLRDPVNVEAHDKFKVIINNASLSKRLQEWITISKPPKFKYKGILLPNNPPSKLFNHPSFVISDKQGNIFVSNRVSFEIQVFDSYGKWKQNIRPLDNGNNQPNWLMGIAFNSKKHLVIADENNHRIQILNERMEFVKSFGSFGAQNGHFNNPYGVAVDSEDNIFVADYNNNRIQIFNSDGKWKLTIGKSGSNDGEFYSPYGIVISKKDNRIFVTDEKNNRVQVFSVDGRFLFKFGTEGNKNGQFRCPTGLTLTDCGRYLLVCDRNNHRIQVFDSNNGEFIESYGTQGKGNGQFENPCGICFSPNGLLLISEYGNHRVQVFEKF
jgi:DNA-binding beta-propeller fold protein YncE